MATFLDDTFTDTDGTLLTNHTGEIGATWTQHPSASGQFTIVNNRAYCTTSGIVIASGEPASADYDIVVDYRYLSNTNLASIIGRLSPSAFTGYMFRRGSSAWELYRAVSGSLSLLDSDASSVSINTNYQIRMSFRGTIQRCYVDDVLVCEAADTQITTPGRVGLRDTSGATSTGGKHIDRITGIIPDTAPRPSRVFTLGSPHNIGPLRVGRR